MTPVEFRQRLADADAELLDLVLRSELTPFVFAGNDTAWAEFRNEIALGLGADPATIRVVGSGRLGFSLKPSNNLRGFQDTSDIDVVVVNPNLFDDLWLRVLNAAYPRPPNQGDQAQRDRQRELYTGWLSPMALRFDTRLGGERVRPALDFKTSWFNVFKDASRHVIRRHEDVAARLYRTWEHANLYHLDSVRALRRSLENGEQA